VFWDGNFSGKLRYDIYEPYKSGRGKDYINGTHPIDEVELTQRVMVWNYLNEMYIRQIRHEVVESDDFIAYYCLKKKNNEKITIVSSDRDFLQLISEDIRIYFLDLKGYYDLSNYREKFNFHQGNSVLMKIMLGDTSDTIKGIKGLGEDTLLARFPEFIERKVTLNEVIENAKKQQEERLANKQKPLKILDNIINGVTDGVQKNRIYEINERLVDLSKPMMTEDSIRELNHLMEGTLDSSGRELKNVFEMMKRDELHIALGGRYEKFLDPFKELIPREKNFIN
jgi:5'-3' exonuclease